MPVRAASVSRQMTERCESAPVGLPSMKGELAKSAVTTGCNASPARNFLTMSASLVKSRLAWIVAVRNIMSSPSAPTFGI